MVGSAGAIENRGISITTTKYYALPSVHVYLYPEGENITTHEYLDYIIDDERIATINDEGLITGLSSGTTTVSAIYSEPQAYVLSEEVMDVPEGALLATATILVTAPEPGKPSFTAAKSGESTKLWLESAFYKDLAENYPNRIIKFNWDTGAYTLPLNCDEVLKEIDSSAKKVNILIEKVDDEKIIKAARESAENMGEEIISDLIKFSVYIEKSKGNKEISSLNFYADRTMNYLDAFNENISTAMKFVDDKECLTFAPSLFDDDFVTVKYRGNGIFTVIENPQTFNDISSHWAKLNIEKLATRNIARQ